MLRVQERRTDTRAKVSSASDGCSTTTPFFRSDSTFQTGNGQGRRVLQDLPIVFIISRLSSDCCAGQHPDPEAPPDPLTWGGGGESLGRPKLPWRCLLWILDDAIPFAVFFIAFTLYCSRFLLLLLGSLLRLFHRHSFAISLNSSFFYRKKGTNREIEKKKTRSAADGSVGSSTLRSTDDESSTAGLPSCFQTTRWRLQLASIFISGLFLCFPPSSPSPICFPSGSYFSISFSLFFWVRVRFLLHSFSPFFFWIALKCAHSINGLLRHLWVNIMSHFNIFYKKEIWIKRYSEERWRKWAGKRWATDSQLLWRATSFYSLV